MKAVTRALGVDLGGTKLLVCLTDRRGRVLAQTSRPTGRRTGPDAALALVTDAARELRNACGPFDCAGVGFPGLVDFSRGVARSSVMLDAWRDVPLARLMTRALGVPCVVDNDVNAAAYAELDRRRDDPPSSMLFVAVGTGIGGAIALDGRLWRGSTGVAGEIGNMTIDHEGRRCWCGRRGCLNTFGSGTAIARSLGLSPGLSLTERWRARDRRATVAVERAARSLGVGIANALNLLNPDLVVIGGGVSRLGVRFLESVARTARMEAFSEAATCRFEPPRAGYEAGAVGSALLALAALSPTTSAARAARAATRDSGVRRPSAIPRAVPSSGPRARRRAPRRIPLDAAR